MNSNFEDTNSAHLIASLVGTNCALNHGHDDPPQAVEYIRQPMGKVISDIEIEVQDEFAIPVCYECYISLGTEWVLFYCMNCGVNDWGNRNYKKIRENVRIACEGHQILWFGGCPWCTTEQKCHGLWLR